MSGRKRAAPIAQVVLVEIEPSTPGEPCRTLGGAVVVAVTARTGRPATGSDHAFRVADADLPRLAGLA